MKIWIFNQSLLNAIIRQGWTRSCTLAAQYLSQLYRITPVRFSLILPPIWIVIRDPRPGFIRLAVIWDNKPFLFQNSFLTSLNSWRLQTESLKTFKVWSWNFPLCSNLELWKDFFMGQLFRIFQNSENVIKSFLAQASHSIHKPNF